LTVQLPVCRRSLVDSRLRWCSANRSAGARLRFYRLPRQVACFVIVRRSRLSLPACGSTVWRSSPSSSPSRNSARSSHASLPLAA